MNLSLTCLVLTVVLKEKMSDRTYMNGDLYFSGCRINSGDRAQRID